MSSAMGNDAAPPGMSEAHLLAPWYATGKLDSAEMSELEELANQDPELASALEAAKHEAEATVLVNEALGEAPRAVWERLSKSVELEQRDRTFPRFARLTGNVKDSVHGFLEQLTKPQWQAVAAFALALCVIQAGAIVYLGLQSPAKYSVASGPQASTRHAAFIVSFSDSATMTEIGEALDEAGVVIVDGPNAERLYHLSLRDDSVKAKEQAYEMLRSSATIKLILPEK